MATKTVVYNFIKEQAPIIHALVEQKIIDIAEWFCYPPHGTVDIKAFADVTYRTKGTYGLGEETYDQVLRSYPTFLDMHQRRSPFFHNTLYDTMNDFTRQFGAVYSLLSEQKPRLVLFSNIPHGGHDLLLYEVAKSLGIRTLILYQVPVCPRFFILEDLEDFGKFRTQRNDDNTENLEIPEIKTPFYATYRQQRLKPALRDLKIACRRRMLDSWMVQRQRQRRYLADLRSNVKTLAPGTRYVYFPLHLQPEMTTSAIGGIYVDQMLAIERLARRLPPDVRVVVKENPKQSAYQRPHGFFERLAAISNAVLVPSNVDTYQLIRGSELVATVTGTAGWEAINLGKPTLIFGKAWYESLPGVEKYVPHLDIVGMMGSRVDKQDVERAYRDLMGKAYPGIISSPYFKLSPGIDVENNNVLVVNGIRRAIQNAT